MGGDLGTEEGGGGVVGGAEGRHVNQPVDSSLTASLRHPPGTLNVSLLVAEVSVHPNKHTYKGGEKEEDRCFPLTITLVEKKKKKKKGKLKPCLVIPSNQVEDHLRILHRLDH